MGIIKIRNPNSNERIYSALPAACISESYTKIKINLNVYFHTALRCLKKVLWRPLRPSLNFLRHHNIVGIGVSIPPQKPPPLFLATPPLNQQTVQAPPPPSFLGNPPPPIYWFFKTPLLKVESFSETKKY